jgi:hypothetical protein
MTISLTEFFPRVVCHQKLGENEIRNKYAEVFEYFPQDYRGMKVCQTVSISHACVHLIYVRSRQTNIKNTGVFLFIGGSATTATYQSSEVITHFDVQYLYVCSIEL